MRRSDAGCNPERPTPCTIRSVEHAGYPPLRACRQKQKGTLPYSRQCPTIKIGMPATGPTYGCRSAAPLLHIAGALPYMTVHRRQCCRTVIYNRARPTKLRIAANAQRRSAPMTRRRDRPTNRETGTLRSGRPGRRIAARRVAMEADGRYGHNRLTWRNRLIWVQPTDWNPPTDMGAADLHENLRPL